MSRSTANMCARASRISPRTRTCRAIFFSALEHDLFRKPVSTPDQVRGRLFRDHALATISPDASVKRAGPAMAGEVLLESDPQRPQFRQCEPKRHRATQNAALGPLRSRGAL